MKSIGMDHLMASSTSGATWLATTALLLTILALTVLRKRESGKAGCVPVEPPVLHGAALVKFVCAIMRDGPVEAICVQQAKLGSVFTASLLGLFKMTFLVGPEASSHFYRAPESEISQGSIYEFTVPMFGPVVGYGIDLATRNEQLHFTWDVLKPQTIRASMGAMVKEVEDYFSGWGEHGTVDLKRELEQVLLLIMSRCLLGMEAREKMFDEVCKLFRDLDNGVRFISVLFPYLPTQAHRHRDKARVRLTEIFTAVVRSRRSRSGASKDNDVLQRLIDSKYKDGRTTTEAEVVGLLIAIMYAGKHTSSSASTWTGIHLLFHPNHMASAVDEQDQLMAWHHGADCCHVDYKIVQEMSTLHRCVKEALRLHPPVMALCRQTRERFTVKTKEGKEYTIPKGHTVMSTILVNHHLPHVYKDPHVYDPDRFMPGRQEDRAAGPLSYLAFGAGKHMCMGQSFALTQIKVIWSHLLRNFELNMVSPFPKIKWSAVVPEPKGKVMVSYKRRVLTRCN